MPMQNQGTPDVCNTRKLIDSDISGYENDLHARRDIRQGRRNTGIISKHPFAEPL
jgi:hypothetical protein